MTNFFSLIIILSFIVIAKPSPTFAQTAEDIQRSSSGEFFVPLLSDRFYCRVQRQNGQYQELVFYSWPFSIEVWEPQGSYEIFSGAKVSIDSECSGSVLPLRNRVQLKLECKSPTEEQQIQAELGRRGGRISLSLRQNQIAVSRTWSLNSCSQVYPLTSNPN